MIHDDDEDYDEDEFGWFPSEFQTDFDDEENDDTDY